MFVREKRVGKYVYHQLVESYRDGGEVRQRVLAHLGKSSTLDEAIKSHRNHLSIYREILSGSRRSPSERAMWARKAARHEKKLEDLTQLQLGLEERSD